MAEKAFQEANYLEDLILIENMDDSSGDTSGVAEFLDEVREGREKRKAARLRKATKNASKQGKDPTPQSSSPSRVHAVTERRDTTLPKKVVDVENAKVKVKPADVPFSAKTVERGTGNVKKRVEHDKSKATPKPEKGRKRKRAPSFELVAEHLRVFDGLSFFFLPNDDKRLGRKIRIKRAREHGAVWIRDWGDTSVTHVIVEDNLTYEDILKYFNISQYPSDRSFVNTQWPHDCIHFRFLVEPDQVQYDVDGFPRQRRVISEGKKLDTASTEAAEPDPRSERLTSPPGSITRADDQDVVPQQKTKGDQGSHSVENQDIDSRGISTSSRARDELDEAIEATQKSASLPIPLDGSDSDTFISAQSAQHDISEEVSGSPSDDVDSVSEVPAWQSKFSCMHSSTAISASSNPNAVTIDVLQQMSDYYARTKDQWRHLTYRRAVSALKRTAKQITTKEEARAIPGIGDSIADKIQEIVTTNRLRKLESAQLDPNEKVLKLFCDVYGSGLEQAQKWFAQGFRTLEDLRQKAQLTHAQSTGVKYYNDFLARIPREEVEAHGNYARSIIQAIDPSIEIVIGGSYRRGAADSGDIDFLVTKADASLSDLADLIFNRAFTHLNKSGYIKAHLTTPNLSSTSWHGAVMLPHSITSSSSSSSSPARQQLCRRLDIILVPPSSWGAALIYFTGNDIFNRSMRNLAKHKGMRLNQSGLYKDVMRGKGGKKVTEGVLVEGRDERRIFEVLGVPWRESWERNC